MAYRESLCDLCKRQVKPQPAHHQTRHGLTSDALLPTVRRDGALLLLGGRRLVVDGDCKGCDFEPAGAMMDRGEKSVVAASRGLWGKNELFEGETEAQA